jgi:AcrR family transcriptional regulator
MFVVCHDGHMAVSAELRRRQPVQERSRKRVERILASALNLLNAGGADAVTTRAIASAAGIPVATVYQFFPNREAILVELLEAFLARRDVEGLALLAELTPATLDEVFGEICRFHRDGLAEYPHMADLYYTYRANGMVPDARDLRAAFAKYLHSRLTEWGIIDAAVPRTALQFAVELGDHIIELAHHSGPDAARILDEGVRAITSYLRSYDAPD